VSAADANLSWRIGRFVLLQPGWDGRDGTPPTQATVTRAQQVARAAPLLQASPTGAGTVLLESPPRWGSTSELCIEVGEAVCHIWHGAEPAYTATLDDTIQAATRWARQRTPSRASLNP